MTTRSGPRSTGKVRAARLTDLAALGELSRLCQSDGADTRSLGPAGERPADRRLQPVPPAARRLPAERPDVRLRGGRPASPASSASSARASATSGRSWSSTRVGMADAGDIRYRLVQQLLREGAKRGAARFHVACADADGNVELFMQAGFMRYGEERVLFAPGRQAPARAVDGRAGGGRRDPRRRSALDALALSRLYAAATPAPVARLEAIRLADWERQGTHWRVPRSSLAPILRFADVEGFVQAAPDGGRTAPQLDGFLQVGRREGGPAALPQGHGPARGRPSALVGFGLGVIAARPSRRTVATREHGVIAPVRTYESPIDRRLEEAGFDSIASVTLLMKETLVRVAEPALVPAGVR